MFTKLHKTLILTFLLFAILATACAPATPLATETTSTEAPANTNEPAKAPLPDVKLTLGGYTTPREAYGEIIPLFQTYWLEKTGQKVTFEESYQGSGAQSR